MQEYEWLDKGQVIFVGPTLMNANGYIVSVPENALTVPGQTLAFPPSGVVARLPKK